MTSLKCTLIFAVFIWILWSCNSDFKNNNSTINDESNKFIGEWNSTKRLYPFGSTLKINKDSSFSYEYGSCAEHGISSGKWKIIDHNIVLINDKPDSSLFLIPFDYRGTPFVVPDGKSNPNADFPIIQKKAKSYENQFVLFNSDKLYIRNDTLFHITKFKNLDPGMRNMFIKKKNRS